MRKSPVYHIVKYHRREGKLINSYNRGKGIKTVKVIGGRVPQQYQNKYGQTLRMPGTIKGFRLKVSKDISGRVDLFCRRLGLDRSKVVIKFTNRNPSSGRAAELRAKFVLSSNEILYPYTLYINTDHYALALMKSPIHYDYYLDYSVTHELAHAKQFEELGPRKVKALPSFMREDYAEEASEKVTGMSEEEVKSHINAIEVALHET